ncbi:hypothetical protein MNBD_GAMMA26-2463 [hydrothermal vent metagenome]|uniref:Uncharacterized protein n=1 Tax=hydrothermal vent metagenome TaxID=652676 RepID=A0A3B1AZ61_9ZZZZ
MHLRTKNRVNNPLQHAMWIPEPKDHSRFSDAYNGLFGRLINIKMTGRHKGRPVKERAFYACDIRLSISLRYFALLFPKYFPHWRRITR